MCCGKGRWLSGNCAAEPHELMQRFADFCQSRGIAYWVVGSMASMDYGEPRLTIDIDIVADLKIEHVARECAAFATGSRIGR
jgi:hypothetical protein